MSALPQLPEPERRRVDTASYFRREIDVRRRQNFEFYEQLVGCVKFRDVPDFYIDEVEGAD